MIKVMAFGTFDVLHPGHRHFLKDAKNLGDYLTVVVARDLTVKEVKGKFPLNNEQIRLKTVSDSGLADKVILGGIGSKYDVIFREKPDFIALGYDQTAFTDELHGELQRHGLDPKIERIDPFMPQTYKTSKIIRKLREEKEE